MRRHRRTCSGTSVSLGAWALLIGWMAASAASADDLAALLRPLIEAHQGQVACSIEHLESGESFQFEGDRPMSTASLVKLPVMVEAYRQANLGQVDLAKMLTVRDADKVPGSGILTSHFSDGTQISLRDAVRLMIAYSDNTATNLVVDQIGIRAVAETMEGWGYSHTKLHAKVFRRETSVFPERSERFGLGSTTSNEMIRLLKRLWKRDIVTPDACDAMLEHLRQCQDKSMLARSLPAGVKLAHKTGAVTAVRCDAGILESAAGPIAVCVLTQENQDRRWSPENAAELLCAEIGKRTHAYFHARKPRGETAIGASPTGAPVADAALQLGATGSLVEALQRTLNARMTPDTPLTVDGEFGPVTRDAVMAWQRQRGLNVTGQVDRATWDALGPLMLAPEPVPDPEVVNAADLPQEPEDALDGHPFVSCKAWAIAEAKSGAILWGTREHQSLDNASTTKMMTAYVVLRLAERQPEVLDEVLTFSEAADQTPGSTADIHAGERVTVRETLYGLMLPSGNDAATALAEHFGDRFANPSQASAPTSAGDRFVAEMNRTARELRLSQTQFQNPHGLTTPGHHSSAADLAQLAHAALRIQRFRDYMGTRQRGASVTGPGGYRRNVVWKNTNRLLDIEGYQGIKTGTTDAAGACLVSLGQRGSDELIVVILGATSPDGRYVDARNLFRWAWGQRAKSVGE